MHKFMNKTLQQHLQMHYNLSEHIAEVLSPPVLIINLLKQLNTLKKLIQALL